MKRSLKELSGYSLETKDGKIGSTKDFLFDEKQWTIRYLEGDFGGWFSSDRILIPRVFLKPPQWDSYTFPTEIKTVDIERCPKIQEHLPVSQEYENELSMHYEINPYWASNYISATDPLYPPRPVRIPDKIVDEKNMESILRSFEEIKGYEIEALDGKFGQVVDLIIDDEDWQIIYVIVDTKLWLPWSKKVMIGVEWLDEISYTKGEVKIKLSTEDIKNAPEFDPNQLVDKKYEKVLFDYYSGSLLR